MLSAIHHSLNKLQGGSEVSVSLLALLAGMIKHGAALILFGAVGSYSPGIPEFSDEWCFSLEWHCVSCYLPSGTLHL